MRLIDADRVKQYVLTEGFYCDTNADKEATAEMIDQLFPTVEAIPIEWIKEKVLGFLMDRNFRWATDFQEVIDMWKVENNIPLFDDELKITLEEENGRSE